MANPATRAVIGVYVVYGLLIWLGLYIASLFYRANAFGNMVLLGPKQFPELHAMVVAGSTELGFQTPPRVFLYNSNGLFNAFARRLFGGQYVFLTSALVEANSDEQVRFVIGHELGHHAAGHLNGWLNFVRAPSHAVPFLNAAYSRSREYTCDSIGAHLSKDLAASRSALQMLGCGCRRLNQTMSCEAFVAQEAMVPPVFGFLNEIFRSHPRLTRRVAAIRERTFGSSSV
jgi:Zn-dependent protease with chaperone function